MLTAQRDAACARPSAVRPMHHQSGRRRHGRNEVKIAHVTCEFPTHTSTMTTNETQNAIYLTFPTTHARTHSERPQRRRRRRRNFVYFTSSRICILRGRTISHEWYIIWNNVKGGTRARNNTQIFVRIVLFSVCIFSR